MTDVDLNCLPMVAYDLLPHGPALYPRLTTGCFWCGSGHDHDGRPEQGSACPVRPAPCWP